MRTNDTPQSVDVAAPAVPAHSGKASAARDRDAETRIRQAVDELEEDIVLGYLHPRERLVEDDLRARFDLKRHVARQILQELEKMGLVERKKNVGAQVKSYTTKEVVDLYNVREILETHCVRQIAFPVSRERLDELAAIQRRHDAAVTASDLRAAFRANIAFHKAFFALSDNASFAELIEFAAQRAHSIRSLSIIFPHYLEKARQDHWRMIEALGDGDQERLVALCRDHLVPSRDAYIEQHRHREGKPERAGGPLPSNPKAG